LADLRHSLFVVLANYLKAV
jgi:chromosome segregation ATPase